MYVRTYVRTRSMVGEGTPEGSIVQFVRVIHLYSFSFTGRLQLCRKLVGHLKSLNLTSQRTVPVTSQTLSGTNSEFIYYM